MTKRTLTISVLATAAIALALPASAQDAKKVDKGEAELAELLEGYTSGEPIRCISKTQQDRLRIIDETALVFRSRGTIFVNRTTAPRYLDDFDIPVFKKFASGLCRSDQVEMVGRGSNFVGPIFQLTEFVPYTKVETDG